MNAQCRESSAADEFLFCDQHFHARFSLAIELLARIVTARQHKITTQALCETLAHSPRTVRPLLASLHQAGLLQQDDREKDAWCCPSSLDAITLADIYRCVAASMPEPARKRKSPAPAAEGARGAASQNIELLVMQATMGINQVVLQHLQSFDLGRLKAVGATGTFHRPLFSARSRVAEAL